MNDNHEQKIEQIRQMLASRYGKGFEFRRLGEVSERDLSADYISRGEDLLIPLRIKSSYLGTAVVTQGAALEDENHKQISQLIRLILEPSLYSSYLERTESNLRAEVSETLSGVIPLTAQEPSEPANGSSRLTSNLVYFRGHDTQRTRKAALLLHEMTGRWAFVPWNDIAPDIESVADLRRLGSVTLFCDSVDQITLEQQKILSAFRNPARSSDEPLVIVAGGSSITSLREAPERFDAGFLESVVTHSLDLNRTPLSESGLREVLAIMYVREGDE